MVLVFGLIVCLWNSVVIGIVLKVRWVFRFWFFMVMLVRCGLCSNVLCDSVWCFVLMLMVSVVLLVGVLVVWVVLLNVMYV